ncbi:MAG: choice-of-anchor L domain-containing protein [Taibaiella sp.]|nr:choice-of-anchor L domain-containing protein [Taibaiella sp.]
MFHKIYNTTFFCLIVTFFITSVTKSSAQLTITPSSTSALLAAKLAGPGITILSDTLICNNLANGTFTSVSTPIAIDSGIILSTGKAADATGAESPVTSTGFGGAGDADLTSLLGTTTVSKDQCALIINFIPKGDTISFNYQFGSEEYRSSTCGIYNDAFAFFISGPGVSSTLPGVNMALVPGTTIPVTVNSINSGTPGSGYSIATCNAMGSGSPFTAYYINNAGGTQVTYRGYTTVLTAKHWVIPCDTYRIKMAIVDAANATYDSGVFIEAGSFKTNSYELLGGNTILGVPNAIVKGCGPDSITIKTPRSSTVAATMRLTYAGTAVSGVDYTTLPDSVILNAGDTTVSFPVVGLPTTAAGVKTIVAYLTTSSVCGVVDTLIINVLDKPDINILTNDTTICIGATIQLSATASTGLTFNWTPASSLNNPAILTPIATVASTTTYTLIATLPGSNCPAFTDTVRIEAVSPVASILTPDTTVCQGKVFDLRVSGDTSYSYNWTPGTGLSSFSVKDPAVTAMSTITYSMTASFPGTACSVTKIINITVISTDYTITTKDTFFCTGAILVLNADINPMSSTYTYMWNGPGGYTSVLLNPVITTVTEANAGNYVLTVTNSGLCSSTASENIIVYPTPPSTMVAPPITICQYSPAMPLHVYGYNNLMWYSSAADITPSVFPPLPNTDSIGVFQYYAAQISFQNNCISEKTIVDVTVKSCCAGTVFVPTGFTPNADGLNDVLKVVRSEEYALTDFVIFDRWGTMVFHSSGDQQAWDGTVNGQPADIGTYFYSAVVNCTHSDKKPITLKGDVSLIR